MNLFRKAPHPPSSVDDAQRQLASLRDALQRTTRELTGLQHRRDEAIKGIGELRAQASLVDGAERSSILEDIESQTREHLLLAEAELSTTKRAVEVLKGQVEEAEQLLTRAKLTADRDQVSTMIARYETLATNLEETVLTRLLPVVEEMAHLSSRIEPRIDRLRGQSRSWEVDVPKFDRTPIISVLSQRLLKAWNAGTQAVERHEAALVAELEKPDLPTIPPNELGETFVNAAGHAWTYTMLEELGGKCTWDGHCVEPTVSELRYVPPGEEPRVWMACQHHLENFKHKHFGRQAAFAGR